MGKRINLIVSDPEPEEMMNLDSDNQIAIKKFREMIIDIQDLYQRNAELLDRIISLENKHRPLSQKTKASEPDRRAHRMNSPTKEFLKNHPCCGCIDWVEEKQECVADPLPGNVNTCFKAKEALYK